MEDLEKALLDSQYCDELPILRQCMVCKGWLDKKSDIIAHARPVIEHVLSHGLCDPCEKQYLDVIF